MVQVKRMKRTINEATVKRYHYGHREQLKQHLDDFIHAYNYDRRLKTLNELTTDKFICKCWANKSERLNHGPCYQMLGLNMLSRGLTLDNRRAG